MLTCINEAPSIALMALQSALAKHTPVHDYSCYSQCLLTVPLASMSRSDCCAEPIEQEEKCFIQRVHDMSLVDYPKTTLCRVHYSPLECSRELAAAALSVAVSACAGICAAVPVLQMNST